MYHYAWLTALLVFLGSLTTSAVAQENTTWETRVIVTEFCPVAEKDVKKTRSKEDGVGFYQDPSVVQDASLAVIFAAVASAVVPKLIDAGVSVAAQHLKDFADREKAGATQSGMGVANGFYTVAKDPNGRWVMQRPEKMCIALLTGRFTNATASQCNAFKSKHFRPICQEMIKLGLRYDPQIYIENSVEFSPDSSAFRIRTVFADYRVPLHEYDPYVQECKTNCNQGYDLDIDFRFDTVGANGVAQAFASAKLLFRDLKARQTLESNALTGKTSSWLIPPTATSGFGEFSGSISALVKEKNTTIKNTADKTKENEKAKNDIGKSTADVKDLVTEYVALKKSPKIPVPKALSGWDDTPRYLKDVAEWAVKELAEDDDYDDKLLKARLDRSPATNPESQTHTTAEAKATAAENRATRERAVARAKALLTKVKDGAAAVVTALTAFVARGKEIEAAKEQLAEWEAAVGEKKPVVPFTVTVTVAEKKHELSNKFLISAADALYSSKQDISSILQNAAKEAIKSATPEGELAEAQAKATLKLDCVSKKQSVLVAQEVVEKATGKTPAEMALLKYNVLAAQTTANFSCVKAGESPPYSDVYGGNL